jgi:hypothetical protein
VGKSERKRSLNLGVDGRIRLEWISKKSVGRMWTGFIWLRIGTNGELY